jgi:hypothetical protein
VTPFEIGNEDLMHATLARRTFNRAGWVFENKLDGFRVLATWAARIARIASNARESLRTLINVCRLIVQSGAFASMRMDENQAARLAMSSSLMGLATTFITSCRRSPFRNARN